ncbi:hypothetical protein AVEN_140563-1 [Araneus ventricosus]|uniref:Uncharacterized protein n=1 Tax=Araneus ventricosus TaxID=182803 RepID=A0A4Y2V587_ARAVE|nr:hypothetical protein AVEN_140563-1 [Araneus ventricosus]
MEEEPVLFGRYGPTPSKQSTLGRPAQTHWTRLSAATFTEEQPINEALFHSLIDLARTQTPLNRRSFNCYPLFTDIMLEITNKT